MPTAWRTRTMLSPDSLEVRPVVRVGLAARVVPTAFVTMVPAQVVFGMEPWWTVAAAIGSTAAAAVVVLLVGNREACSGVMG